MDRTKTPPTRTSQPVQRKSAEPVQRSAKAAMRGLSFDEGERALAPVQADGGHLQGDVQAIAGRGVAGGGGKLPHAEAIQRSFGKHDVGNVQAHVGGAAADATAAIGASAYATGNDVAFGASPDLHTAAHEAAHVVQQRAGVSLYGGVGQAGDVYEKHADAVADAVVQGKSAEGLLDTMAGSGGAASEGPVQMYSRVPVGKQKNDYWNAGVDLRVADDGRMAVADATHQMWATPDIIATGDNALLAQKSPYSLMTGGNAISGRAPSDKKGAPQTLQQVVPVNYANNSMGNDMRTVEACSSHGQELMGAGPDQGSHAMAKGMAVVTNGQGGEEERRYDKRGMSGHGKTDQNIVGDIRAEVTGKPRDQAEVAYGKMSDKSKGNRAKELGINQYASPEVGEGLAVYSAVKNLQRGHFPMHFAPVIAKSGSDYVTLENYAKTQQDRKQGDTSDSSNDWYFKMFGGVKKGEDQSFFGEIAKEGDYGGKKGTMVLRHRMVEGYEEPEEVLDAKPIMQKCGRWAYSVSEKLYPTFAPKWRTFKLAYDAARQDLARAWTEERDPNAQLLNNLVQAQGVVEQTDVLQDLMNDRNPTPEVPPVDVNDLPQQDTSNDSEDK